ncbi:type II secretion system F family protein [Candidatus Curtissbacteria bacterium]|nr:type II secretion system F family protein [Candidatus Curtissbacteria bacterium]
MAIYHYIGGNQEGVEFKGELAAEDVNSAAVKIRRQGLFVLSLRKSSQIGPFDLENLGEQFVLIFRPELSSIERVLFTTHLASMLRTGVPMIDAIAAFQDDTGMNRTSRMFKRIAADLESGKPLSSALARYPRTFSPVYTHIVSSGESTGNLAETLEYLGSQLRRDYELTSRVKGALMYPIVVITVMFSVLVFITVSVVPKLLTFAQNIGRELPLSTRILIALTHVLIAYGVLIFILVIATVGLGLRASRTARGKAIIDAIILRVPIIGPLVHRFNIARFSRLLGSFYHYGIPLPTAFTILATSVPNLYYQQAVNRIKERMAHGLSLSASIDVEKAKLFPKLLVRVLRTAEKSADVDVSLTRLAEYYESELENTLKNVTTIIEPILILILGIAVMGIAIAVVIPIYQLTTSFK